VIASTFLALGCSEDSPTAPAADTTPPPIPAQVSPANGTEFTHFPRAVTLVWNPVTDPTAPVTYRVEAQFCQSANPSNCTTGATWCPGALTEISCSFNFVGGQPGRWRVKAVDAAGNESAFSAYRTFSFDS
jgi:hypothetical protein